MAKNMYGISVDGAIVSTVADATIASTIASAVGGVVVEVSKAQASSFVKSATNAPSIPPRFAELLAGLKSDIKAELADDKDTCYEFTMRFDQHANTWYISAKNLAAGPIIWNRQTGEKHKSACHMRWERSLSCAVKCLTAGYRIEHPTDSDKTLNLYTTRFSDLPQLIRERAQK
jgi:hypothetical protein